MLIWKKELWLIDHGSGLYFQYNWVEWEKKATAPFMYIKDHVLLPQATRMEEADNICRQMINEEKLLEIVQQIPDEWLKWQDTKDTPEQLRKIYFTFLNRRLNNSKQFINEVQDAAKIHL